MVEQKELITILKDAISQKKSDVKKYNMHLDKNLSEKIELLENLRKDVNEIIKMDINQLNAIVDIFSVDDEEKKKMKEELDVIKAVLTLNQTEKTSYTLLPNQLATISKFTGKLEEYIDKKNQEQQSIDPEYNHIITLTKQYKELLCQLKNPNNNVLITDVDTILQLFQESKISEEEKQAILLSLIKYNREVIEKYEKEQNSSVGKLTAADVSTILKKYGYNFFKLDKKYQDKLCNEGSSEKICEVLDAMQRLEFLKFDEETEGLIFTTYLLATSKDSIEEVTRMAQERGINISTIKQLVSAFIPKDYLYDGKYKIGKMEDFKKNLSLLAEHGISIPVVAFKEIDLLISSNDKLKINLDWLEKYGLYHDMQEDELLDDFLSALKSNNIPEIIDLWIENHSLGLAYIKNNLSVLSSYFSDSSLLFYKLYKCQLESPSDAFRLTMASGVRKLHLKKEFTDDSIAYQGISDKQSAFDIIGCMHVSFDKEKEYKKVAEESLHCPISDDIFERDEIIKLNQFSDSKETLLYDIRGLKISKLKVLRIYDSLCKHNLGNTVDALLYAICYQKIITEDQYHQLLIDINKLVGLGVI